MDRLIYTALSGAKQTLEQQSIVANNMANVSTPGFRAQLAAFRAVPVEGDGYATRAVTVATTPGADLSAGALMATGRSLDIAIDGEGWLAVQSADGTEAYTRAGGLQVDPTGQLMSQGRPVLGEDGNALIMPLEAQITIAGDGTISALGPGDQPDAINEVGRLKLVNPEATAIERGNDGLFRQKAQANGDPLNPLQADPLVRVVSGTVESSNVNPTEAMVAMIDNARRFEMNMKVISSADENEQRANQILSMS